MLILNLKYFSFLFAAFFMVVFLNYPANAQSEDASKSDIRGLIVAEHKAVISAQNNFQILEILKKPGDNFDFNSVLVKFNCDELLGKKNVAEAEMKAKKVVVDNKVYLKSHGAAGDLDVALAVADHNRSQQEYKLAEIKIKDCEIRAPFSGTVVAWEANPFEIVRFGAPILTIEGNVRYLVEMVVAAPFAISAQIDDEFQFRVDGTKNNLRGKIVRISSVVDPVSQTAKIFGSIIENSADLLSGLSGSIEFKN